MPTAVFQLRADDELLREVKERAGKRRVSANRFLVEAIKETLKREKEREWQAGFEAMGSDPDVNDVEYMLPAAQEVLFGREH